MSISRRLAEQLGGRILVQSQQDVGSTFTLRIPTGPLHGVALTRPDLRSRPLGAGTESRLEGLCIGCRALVVDDLEEVQHIAAYFLERAGARVELAYSGPEALAKVAQSEQQNAPFEVILMDMLMPGMRGDETVALLRQRGFDRPILAVTASAMKEQRVRWLSAGCNDVIAKPIDGLVLVRTVASHLARYSHSHGGLETERRARSGKPLLQILLVEDSFDAAESMCRLLESRGAWVEVAHSGQEALEHFREQEPELVLMDLNLPDIDGLALVRLMIAQQQGPGPFFVSVSGLSDPEDAARAREAGFHLHLVKPVDPSRLFEVCDQARGRRSAS